MKLIKLQCNYISETKPTISLMVLRMSGKMKVSIPLLFATFLVFYIIIFGPIFYYSYIIFFGTPDLVNPSSGILIELVTGFPSSENYVIVTTLITALISSLAAAVAAANRSQYLVLITMSILLVSALIASLILQNDITLGSDSKVVDTLNNAEINSLGIFMSDVTTLAVTQVGVLLGIGGLELQTKIAKN